MNKKDRRMYKAIRRGAILGVTMWSLVFAPYHVGAAGFRGSQQPQRRDTSELRLLERNIELLPDRSNNMHTLIEELHSHRVFFTSGCAPGGKILVDGISTDDVLLEVTVLSSANLVAAATTTRIMNDNDGTQADNLKLTANVWGTQGNNVTVLFTQQTDTNTGQQLLLNTTGYILEVKLATGPNNAYKSSGAAVCNAINNSPIASRLVFCASQFKSTDTVLPMSIVATLVGGVGTVALSEHDITDWATITASGTVTIDTRAAVAAVDGIKITALDKPDN